MQTAKSNAASIKLVLEDIKNISDIRDTNNDGDAVYEEYVVRDIYHHVFNITDKTKGAETSEERLHRIDLCEVQPVVYNGQKQGPKVVFNGEVLKEGVDYTWKDWGDSGSCKDPGEYDVTLLGKGRFAGYSQVHYAIEPSSEPEPGPSPQPDPKGGPHFYGGVEANSDSQSANGRLVAFGAGQLGPTLFELQCQWLQHTRQQECRHKCIWPNGRLDTDRHAPYRRHRRNACSHTRAYSAYALCRSRVASL